MDQLFAYIYVGIISYVIPLILAIGLIFLAYGAFNYFILGPGEEPKREEGRKQLMWSLLLFLLGLCIYLLLAAFLWLIDWANNAVDRVDINEETRIQRVPDVPRRNN